MFFIKSFINLALLIYDYVDKEVNDVGKLQQQLLEARLKYEMDDIPEEEYQELETYLIQRIREIKEKEMEDDMTDDDDE